MSDKKVTLFMGEHPSFFRKKQRLKIFATFWFSELDDARNTWYLGRQSSKSKIVKSKSKIHILYTELNPLCTQNPSQV
jgi:hypothetical protein